MRNQALAVLPLSSIMYSEPPSNRRAANSLYVLKGREWLAFKRSRCKVEYRSLVSIHSCVVYTTHNTSRPFPLGSRTTISLALPHSSHPHPEPFILIYRLRPALSTSLDSLQEEHIHSPHLPPLLYQSAHQQPHALRVSPSDRIL